MRWNPDRRLRLRGRTALVWALLPILAPVAAAAAGDDTLPSIAVVTDADGSRLRVDGRDFMVLGMNWDYLPIGQNYSYDLWGQPDDFV